MADSSFRGFLEACLFLTDRPPAPDSDCMVSEAKRRCFSDGFLVWFWESLRPFSLMRFDLRGTSCVIKSFVF